VSFSTNPGYRGNDPYIDLLTYKRLDASKIRLLKSHVGNDGRIQYRLTTHSSTTFEEESDEDDESSEEDDRAEDDKTDNSESDDSQEEESDESKGKVATSFYRQQIQDINNAKYFRKKGTKSN
jgi:hypothetical protein